MYKVNISHLFENKTYRQYRDKPRIVNWLCDNCEGEVFTMSVNPFEFIFENINDAISFKLAWA